MALVDSKFLVPVPPFHPKITMLETGLQSGSGTKICCRQVQSLFDFNLNTRISVQQNLSYFGSNVVNNGY